jgi:hypothetical protein
MRQQRQKEAAARLESELTDSSANRVGCVIKAASSAALVRIKAAALSRRLLPVLA